MVSPPKQLVKVQIITELLSVLDNQFSRLNLQNFAFISDSILGVSNAVTTRSVARYNSLSYRTVQRFYALKHVYWLMINLLLFKHFVHKEGQKYLLTADETVRPKAGKYTHGLGKFYSSLAKQVIKSVRFLAISIIDIEKKKSCILGCNQLIVNNLDTNAKSET
jgi:transposase